MITIYRLEPGPASYPMIASANDDGGNPIPWVALSGLAGDPNDADRLYAVSDAFLASRLDGQWRCTYGAAAIGGDARAILDRAMP